MPSLRGKLSLLRGAAAILVCFAWCASGRTAEFWSAPAVVSNDVNSDGGSPRFATDGKSRWSAVWEKSLDSDSRYSRSSDNANTWGASTELLEPTGASSDLGNPDIAAEATTGTLLAVWNVNGITANPQVAVARSDAATSSFTSLTPPLSYSVGPFQGLTGQRIASGGRSVWVTAASTSSGSDEKLLLFRTVNHGESWASAVEIDQTTGGLGLDRNISIASDGAQHWVVTWERRDASNPTDIEVFFSRSTNDGVSWSFAAPFSTGSQPVIDADIENAFVALLVQGSGTNSLKAYRTTNAGTSWSGPVNVNSAGPAISDTPANPDVACDGQGNCVAVWSATPTGLSRKRLFFATSANRGQTWSVTDVLTSPTIDASDELPQVEYDGAGKWVTTWQRANFDAGSRQILSSKLVFPIRADLSVTQTDNPDPIVINGKVTYKVTVKNDGPSSATNVVLKDTLPTSSTESITHTQGTHTETSGTVTVTFGTINPGASASTEIAVKLTSTGTFTNVASVTSTEPDVDTQDRVSTETTNVLVEGIDLQGQWGDLTLKIPRHPYNGKLKIKGVLTVTNMGTKHCGESVVQLMFSDDEILSDDDAFVDAFRVQLLDKGESRDVKWDKTIRRRTPWQGKFLLAILDAEKRHDEADEDNNNVPSEELPTPDP